MSAKKLPSIISAKDADKNGEIKNKKNAKNRSRNGGTGEGSRTAGNRGGSGHGTGSGGSEGSNGGR